jgi:hypothetical protein
MRRSFDRLFLYYRQRTSMPLPTASFLPPPPPTPSYIYNSDPHPQHSTLTLRRRMYHIIPHFNSLLIGYGWLHIHIHRICLDSRYFFSLFNLFDYGISILLLGNATLCCAERTSCSKPTVQDLQRVSTTIPHHRANLTPLSRPNREIALVFTRTAQYMS